MTQIHDFDESLRRAEGGRAEPFWDACYRKAFPDMVSHYLNARDNGAQRCGVDRVIVLNSTRIVRVDEKVRFRPDTGDILLEYLSNDRTNAPGWMNKDLVIDYLAYGFVPTQRAYLFPWDMLRRAWLHYGDEWIDRGKRCAEGFVNIEARNKTYSTWSVAVPYRVLRHAVQSASVIQLGEAN